MTLKNRILETVESDKLQQSLFEAEPPSVDVTSEENNADDPMMVAGPLSAIKGLKGLKDKKRSGDSLVSPEADREEIGSYQVVPEARDDIVEKVLEQTDSAPKTGKPGGKPNTVFNLDKIDDTDSLNQHIETVAKVYGADKVPKISYKSIAARMETEMGYDEAFIANVIDTSVATKADPAQVYKMLLALTDVSKRTEKLANKVRDAQADGTLTSDLTSQFRQSLALEGVLAKAVKARQVDIARTLGIFSQARRPSAERGVRLDEIIEQSGGVDDSIEIATRYLALDQKGQRAHLAEQTLGGSIGDIWFTTWINGLLSGLPTHGKNIVGTGTHIGMMNISKLLSVPIGKIRQSLTKGEAGVTFEEYLASTMALLAGIQDGFRLGGEAFKKNRASDPFTKIQDARGGGRDAFAFDFGSSKTGRVFEKALRLYGAFVTVPGRALLAEDEFFKGIVFRTELNGLIYKDTNSEYLRLIETGMSEAEALEAVQKRAVALFEDPPLSMKQEALDAAREGTFTNRLEGSAAKIEKAFQVQIQGVPILRIAAPFIRTPTNVFARTFEYVPGLNLLTRKTRAALANGGQEFDLALSKASLGSTIAYFAYDQTYGGRITGMGPAKYSERQQLEKTGWQPYSLVFPKKQFTKEQLDQLRQSFSVSVSTDSVYIGYAGLEPFSGLLAMAATAAEYSVMEAEDGVVTDLFVGASLGIAEFASELPMLEGVSEIAKVLQSRDGNQVAQLLSELANQGTKFLIGGSPLGVHSSFVAGIERTLNPNASQTSGMGGPQPFGEIDVTTNELTSKVLKTFYKALNSAMARNPLYSDALPPRLDFYTGEPERQTHFHGNLFNNLAQFASPFKLKKSGRFYSKAHQILYEHGIGYHKLHNMNKLTVDGITIELNTDQMQRVIETATADNRIVNDIIEIANDFTFDVPLQDRQAELRSVISEAYQDAKEILYDSDYDVQDQISLKRQEIDNIKRKQGRAVR
jgi:hypothetical protein